MKLKTKILFMLMISIAFIYSACKKATSTPAGPALTPSAVASQVAVGISNSLFGDLSGVDVSEGLGGATNFGLKHKGKVIQDTNPDCSLLIDTTIAAVTDTVGPGEYLTLSGSFKFSFACINNVPSSYTTNESVNIKVISPSTDIDYKIGEAFTLTALTPGSQSSNLSMTGTISSAGSYSILTGNKGSGTSAFNYTLTSLVIDPTIPDILSGSAQFTTSGSGPNGVWNYSGTVTFNGNQMATVTINGNAYHVNLQTGAVS